MIHETAEKHMDTIAKHKIEKPLERSKLSFEPNNETGNKI